MSQFELAQLNIALLKAPIESPQLAEFVSNLDRINALAESSPGFVWRMQSEEGNATAIRPLGDEYIVNLSVWKDIDSLYNYVYRSAHAEIMNRRREWFTRMCEPSMVLWWCPAGNRPTIEEAITRLQILRNEGPSARAFTFKTPHPAPGQATGGVMRPLHVTCKAT